MIKKCIKAINNIPYLETSSETTFTRFMETVGLAINKGD